MPTIDGRELGAVFAGGAAGTLLRVWLSNTYPAAAASWPWAVFAINVSGSFILGYFVTRLQERLPPSTYRRPLVGTGFCGAYTTFATFQLELLRMVDRGHYGLAAGYAGASIVCGYLAVYASTQLARRVRTVA